MQQWTVGSFLRNTVRIKKYLKWKYKILSCLIGPSTQTDIQSAVHYHSLKKYMELKDAVDYAQRTKPEMFTKLISTSQMMDRLPTYEWINTNGKQSWYKRWTYLSQIQPGVIPWNNAGNSGGEKCLPNGVGLH